MSKLYLFAAVVLFWVALSASLVRVQLATAPTHNRLLPASRAILLRSTALAQAKVTSTITALSYN